MGPRLSHAFKAGGEKTPKYRGIPEDGACTSLTLRCPLGYSVFSLELLSSMPLVDRVQFETLLLEFSAQLIAGRPRSISPKPSNQHWRACAILSRRTAVACSPSATISPSPRPRVDFASNGSGVLPISAEGEGLDPWATRQVVLDREPVAFSCCIDLPPEAAVDLASFEAMATKSLLVTPIEVGHKRLHLMTASPVRQEC